MTASRLLRHARVKKDDGKWKPVPFVIDRGKVVPESYVLDVPIDFAGYVAENYDGQFSGRTTLRSALIDVEAPAEQLERLGLA